MYGLSLLEFQNSVCNGCHDLTIVCLDMRDIAIIIIKGVGCRCIIHDISTSDGINLLKKSVLEDRGYIQKCISKKLILKIDSTTILTNEPIQKS